ncbi:hypothetical protein SAY87_002784 [Trapa incisa]|uniref:Uncharacterized protein n=1 Tax=Trapa incisa TaxID=236973 RepID=A0AAN7JTN9_9MYRT|nr:hypothetical protein SAY87_002784 [Trapa incisa]
MRQHVDNCFIWISLTYFRSLLLLWYKVLQNDIDLLNPPAQLEKKKHKLKRLVQSPNSFFMDVKCQGCFNMWPCKAHRGQLFQEKGRLEGAFKTKCLWVEDEKRSTSKIQGSTHLSGNSRREAETFPRHSYQIRGGDDG